MRQIIAAFERQSSCEKLQRLLDGSDEFSCVVCRSGAQVRHAVRKLHVDIVVCGFKLADESCESVFYDLPPSCTMLMLAPRARLELCEAEEILKLSTPVRRSELLSSLRMLARLSRGQGRQSISCSEDERELVVRAKALLMDRYMMTEAQAHRLLQKKSMDAGMKLSQTARAVVDSL